MDIMQSMNSIEGSSKSPPSPRWLRQPLLLQRRTRILIGINLSLVSTQLKFMLNSTIIVECQPNWGVKLLLVDRIDPFI